MIEVKNLTKIYNGHIAVDNLTFSVEKGQVLGFLGPNGAGKSTTMNMITGYISATEGTINIDGHDIFEEPEKTKRCIGYLPEIPPIYPDMTVKEYLQFVAELKLTPKKGRNKMIEDIMNMIKIYDVKDRLIKHLSKGYKQRVGLAQSIVGYPDVIILDEPTVGLDPMQIIEIRELIKDLSKNHTVILSSHILHEISAVCDTIMIINKGKLIISDKTENIAQRMNGSNSLELKVKGHKSDIEKALNKIPDIERIDFKQGENNLTCFTIYTNSNKEIREDIFYALSEERCPIYEMNMNNISLEDIFLELTQDNETIIESKEVNNQENNYESKEKEQDVSNL